MFILKKTDGRHIKKNGWSSEHHVILVKLLESYINFCTWQGEHEQTVVILVFNIKRSFSKTTIVNINILL